MLPIFHFSIERWKYNSDYEVYVSNMGRVKDKKKNDLKPRTNSGGYLSVCIVHNELKKTISIHRLVLTTWKPVPDMDNLTVDHIDHNKRNNKLSNLEWVTREENQQRAREDYVNLIPEKIAEKANIGIVFRNSTQIIVFKDIDEALKVVNAFVKDVEGIDAMRRKIQNSFTTGRKIYGGYWYCNK